MVHLWTTLNPSKKAWELQCNSCSPMSRLRSFSLLSLCVIDINRSCSTTSSRSHWDMPWLLADAGVADASISRSHWDVPWLLADAGVADAVKLMLRRSTFPLLGVAGDDRKALGRGEWVGMGDE